VPVSRRIWIALYAAGVVFLWLAVFAAVLVLRFQPVARSYFISTLRQRYQSDVELGDLRISLFPTVRATGDNLVFRLNGRRDIPPMVQIRRFTLEARFVGFFRNPRRIHRLQLEGLRIQLPPHSAGRLVANSSSSPASGAPFVLDEVIADGTTLETMPSDPAKSPLLFEIKKLTLHTVGIGQPMSFQAEVENPKPPGLIHSDGQFGPWNGAAPTDTPVSGKYTFRDADLSVFKGIAGILSSDGKYTGQLDRIEVTGTTDVPQFSLTIADHPVSLHTEFQATVDGGNGNTVLHPVRARLGRSDFEVSGAIDRTAPATRKTIELEAKTGAARLEDFLRLSVKSQRPPMTGGIHFNTKVKIPPGETQVVDRLQLDGTFTLNGVRFTSPDVQGKIAGLSHHAQGDPNDHDPNVAADFTGSFRLRNGQLALPDLGFTLPGARVDLHGSYALRSGALDFRGTAKLDATVSQMTTGFKSVLLRPLDPLFRRDGAGTVLPIVIRGTRGEPSFTLDIGQVLRRK
jgi:uncharacterized protein involved in outer membrane biogenesis